jgi:hypothetical protein
VNTREVSNTLLKRLADSTSFSKETLLITLASMRFGIDLCSGLLPVRNPGNENIFICFFSYAPQLPTRKKFIA